MRKLWYVSLVFVVFLVLVAGALILMPLNSLRGPLEQTISHGIGRGIHIAGPMHASLFPEIGISASDVSIENVPGGEAKEFAHVGTLAVGAKLLPLFSHELDLTRLTLEGSVIHLEVDASGNANWNFRTSGTNANPSSTSRLSVSGLKITNAEITYSDARTAKQRRLSQVNASVSMAALDQPAVFSLDAVYKNEKFVVSGRMDSPDAYMRKTPAKIFLDLKSRLINLRFDGSVIGTAENSGEFSISGPSLRELTKQGADVSAPSVHGLGAFSITGSVSTKDRIYGLQKARISLDDMKGEADLAVDTKESVPELKGNLHLDHLDLANYMMDKEKEASTTSGWSTKPLSLNGLKRANAEIDVSVDRLSLGTFVVSRGRMQLGLTDGVLTADLTQAGLFNGTATGRIVADARGTVPKFAVNLDVKSVAIQSLLQSAVKVSRIEGTGALTLNATGSGPSQQAIMNNLAGTASVMARNGAIRGVDLAAVSRSITNALSGALGAATAGKASTDFAEAGGTFKISGGVMHNQDFHLLNPFVRISGFGDINLGSRTLEFHVAPKLVATSQGQGGLRDTGGISVPFLVSGPWTKPSYKPDMNALGSTVVDQIKSGNGLGGLLGGVLGGKKSGNSATEPSQKPPLDLNGLFGR